MVALGVIKFSLLIAVLSLIQGCMTSPGKTLGSVSDTVILKKPVALEIPEKVYWAGFAFLGDSSQSKIRYPYTAKISAQKNSQGLAILDAFLTPKISGLPDHGYDLRTGLGALKTGDGLSMAIGISYEDIYVQPLNDQFKVSYEIGLNIIVFDFTDKKMLAVYPLRFLRNELFKQPPSSKLNEKIIQSLYLSEDPELNILVKTLEHMKQIIVRASYGNHIGIRNIKLTPLAIDKIPEKLLKDDIIKTQVAQQFEGLLSANTYTPMVPFTKGEAIGNKMAARFSNGNAYNFKLPELDYFIDLELRGFKEKDSKNYLGFTSLITLQVGSTLSDNVVNSKFSHTPWVLKTMVTTPNKTARWTGYEESLGKLLEDLSKQIASTDSDWVKKHSVTTGVENQFNEFRQLLKRSQ